MQDVQDKLDEIGKGRVAARFCSASPVYADDGTGSHRKHGGTRMLKHALIARLSELVRNLHALHQCHYDADREAAKQCALRVAKVDAAWLTITFCLEHKLLSREELAFCAPGSGKGVLLPLIGNLLRNEKKTLMLVEERVYCESVTSWCSPRTCSWARRRSARASLGADPAVVARRVLAQDARAAPDPAAGGVLRWLRPDPAAGGVLREEAVHRIIQDVRKMVGAAGAQAHCCRPR